MDSSPTLTLTITHEKTHTHTRRPAKTKGSVSPGRPTDMENRPLSIREQMTEVLGSAGCDRPLAAVKTQRRPPACCLSLTDVEEGQQEGSGPHLKWIGSDLSGIKRARRAAG